MTRQVKPSLAIAVVLALMPLDWAHGAGASAAAGAPEQDVEKKQSPSAVQSPATSIGAGLDSKALNPATSTSNTVPASGTAKTGGPAHDAPNH